MSSSSPVYFEGRWSDDDRALVEAAVDAAEATGLPTPSNSAAAPWVATRQVLGDTTLYMAARQEGDSALMDRSAQGLADRIRRFAEQKSTAPSSLLQLIYRSVASSPMTDADLRKLLREARANNRTLGITGLLLHAQGRFLQVLEGPRSAVRRLYATIREDPRHTSVETLFTTSIAERTFPEWAMGLERARALADEEARSDFFQTGTLPAATEPMTDVLDLLSEFRRSASQA